MKLPIRSPAVLILLLAVRTMLAGPSEAWGADSPPHILFIMSDDHATNALGSYGSRLAGLDPTPRLDELAAQGARFTRAFCTNSICSPSRAAILTGQYSHRNGVYRLNQALDPAHPNVAKELREGGYTTAVIGKWHLVEEPSGFDYWNVLPGQGRYFDPVMNRIGGQRNVYQGFSADVITELARQWLAEKRAPDQPFCLMVHYKAVHEPFSAPQRFDGLYEDVVIPEPASLWEDKSHRSIGSRDHGFTIADMAERFVRRGQWQPERPFQELSREEQTRQGYQAFVRQYLRSVAALDESIGRLLDYLDESGLAEDTLVIYTSDQGYFLGEHNYIDKRWMFEESIRMPLILRYPGRIDAGIVRDAMVLNIDFAPLLLDYAGLPRLESMQGRSFRGFVQGDPPADWRQAMYYRYWMHGDGANRPAHYGIRTDRYKLIFFYGLPLGITRNPPTEPGWELYDLQEDPEEVNNVYDDPEYAGVVRQLKRQLADLKDEVGDSDEPYPRLLERRGPLR